MHRIGRRSHPHTRQRPPPPFPIHPPPQPQESVVPMCFLRAKPIGVMQMLDQGEQDDKVGR